jgi:hypothetical protein
MNAAAIAAMVPRRRTVVRGQVISTVTFVRPWVRCDVVINDGTGRLTLRFLGRHSVPGMIPGAQVIAEGTPMVQRNVLVMLNPLYHYLRPVEPHRGSHDRHCLENI